VSVLLLVKSCKAMSFMSPFMPVIHVIIHVYWSSNVL
jgi:hypothetical protein